MIQFQHSRRDLNSRSPAENRASCRLDDGSRLFFSAPGGNRTRIPWLRTRSPEPLADESKIVKSTHGWIRTTINAVNSRALYRLSYMGKLSMNTAIKTEPRGFEPRSSGTKAQRSAT